MKTSGAGPAEEPGPPPSPPAAPAEDAFLTAVARRTQVLRLMVRGAPGAVQAAVVLPDRGQELAWVAARLVEAAAQDGLPLHRLAVTAMDLEHYGPQLERVLAEDRGRLDSTTVRVIEQNLAVIDRAIADARRALAADPGNPYLSTYLAHTMRRKIDLLRQAATIAASRS